MKACSTNQSAMAGEALLEAMIAMVLVSVVGLGLAMALSRTMATQKHSRGQSLTVQQIRADLQAPNPPINCPSAGSSKVSKTLTLATDTLAEASRSCSMAAITVSVGATSTVSQVSLPVYEVVDEALFGPGTLRVGAN